MKIKDVTGERSFTILKDVIPYIEQFGKSELFRKIFSTDDLPEDKEKQVETVSQRIMDNLPDLIAEEKDNLVAYFALLDGVSTEEYLKEVNAGKIVDGMVDMFSDGHFRTFFTPFLKKPTAQG